MAHATAAFAPLPEAVSEDVAHIGRRTQIPTKAFSLEETLASEKDKDSSGGETRTHNLAEALERDEDQHPLE